MINALPATQASALPVPRNAGGGGDEPAKAQNFAQLLGQAGGDARAAACDGAAPQSGSAPKPPTPPGEAATAEPVEHPAAPGAPRKGAAAPGTERKPGARIATRGAARADDAATAAGPAATPGLDSARPAGEATATGGRRSDAPTPADSALVSATPASPTQPTAPPTWPLPDAAAAAAAAAAVAADGSVAAGRHAGFSVHAARAEGQSLGLQQPAQSVQAMQAMQATHEDAATPSALSSRFGDALATASELAKGASESRADPLAAQFQPAALAALPGAAPPAAAPAPAAAEATLAAQPGSAVFASQLGAQVTTFVRNGIEHAQLHLNPAEMGPVTVQIQLDGDSARVHMAAEHGLTRQALEQAMPQLASSLREAGLTLSGGGVFERPRQGQDGADSGRQPGSHAGRQGESSPGSDKAATGPGAGAPRRRGVVDLVA